MDEPQDHTWTTAVHRAAAEMILIQRVWDTQAQLASLKSTLICAAYPQELVDVLERARMDMYAVQDAVVNRVKAQK